MKACEGVSLNMERRWAFPLVISSVFCVFLIATIFNMGLLSSNHTINALISHYSRSSMNQTNPLFVETLVSQPSSPPPPPPLPPLPRFAYLISGSKGDLHKLWRVLQAVYHPRNQYIVHLDLESPLEERLKLAAQIDSDPLFVSVGNVHMITKANIVTYRGPTMVSTTLHACAILLKEYKDWDWFINLSASDYPLVTQDDLIYTFSKLDRKLNFIDHTGRLGWKESGRAMPLMIDPGLYSSTKSDIFWVQPKRSLPTSFKLFTGSAWMVLTHEFVEYLILGWDNLPRTMLMYYTNFVSSPEGYFHTVICNAPKFAKTVVNHDLHYIAWDMPPQQHPHTLTMNDSDKMIASNAAFARKFRQDDPLLDRIDREFLGRVNVSVTPGKWCGGKPRCTKVKNPDKVKPGPGAQRLDELVSRIVSAESFLARQCK
ncbi:beta-glucuronosyltransferase GlcAT14B-like [Amaranthus tricolor]|uniref:beta-glucuronosyltransferase GlcAT14B-like n=1 Tax=Amaranthus tricolor TaxID=29722 RepID=UPI002583C634|nr:beta-glucuronosyltransferase GlcAT14B-like [Amaranthus tricolor]